MIKVKEHLIVGLLQKKNYLKIIQKNITLNDIADFFPNRTNKQVRAKYDYMFKTKRNTLNLLNVGQKKRNKY